MIAPIRVAPGSAFNLTLPSRLLLTSSGLWPRSAGTILIREPIDRLCGIDARISHPVEFGFGLFGKVNENGSVHVVRTQTSGGNWLASLINVFITGRILVFKSITQNREVVRTEIKELPPNLTLVQAAELTRR